MRISADSKDPNYSPDSMNCKVYFNGEYQPACITADDTLGEIIRYKTSASGIVKNAYGEDATETLKGRVLIVRLDPVPQRRLRMRDWETKMSETPILVIPSAAKLGDALKKLPSTYTWTVQQFGFNRASIIVYNADGNEVLEIQNKGD